MSAAPEGVVRWVLVDGGRHRVAGAVVGAAFLVLVGLGVVGVVDVGDQDAVRGVAGGFVPGLVAFLSIVLAINQLVLSQEFGSAGEIYDRIEGVREYREDVEEVAERGPSPVLPTGFLSFVMGTIESEALALEDSVGADADPAVRDAVETYARDVAAGARRANESLGQVRAGRVNALLPVLEFDDAVQSYRARRLRHDHGEALPAETDRVLSDLLEALELFSVARTQFRTTYTQRVLARLSRQLLYVGLPALVAVVVLGLLPPPGDPQGPLRLVVVCGLFAFALSPLAVLASYLLRVAAISERTVSAGPFVSRPDDSGATVRRPPGDRADPPVADSSEGHDAE